MEENKELEISESIVKNARRRTTRRSYDPRKARTEESKRKTVKEEAKEDNQVKRRTRRTTPKKEFKKEDLKETRSLVVRKESALRETPKEKSLKNITEGFGFKKSRLKIIPLGGLHEVGKNITVFQYEDEMIVVDCGLSFPEDDMLGVDLVIPDITYILKNREKLKGLVITHGHEDHIGGVPYFLKQVNTPIYGTRLTLGLIKNKLEEHSLTSIAKLNEVNPGDNKTWKTL